MYICAYTILNVMATINTSLTIHSSLFNRLHDYMDRVGNTSRSSIMCIAIREYLDKKDTENIDIILNSLSDKGRIELHNKLQEEIKKGSAN